MKLTILGCNGFALKRRNLFYTLESFDLALDDLLELGGIKSPFSITSDTQQPATQ